MITIDFTETEIEQLKYERYHHPHPRVQRKMEALLLKSQGIAHQKIAELTGICSNTLRTYLRDYQAGGINKLKEMSFYQPSSELNQHQQSLEEYFHQNPVASINKAMSKIEDLTGIKRSPTRVREFMKSLGIKRRQIGMIPSKANPDVKILNKKNLNHVLMRPKKVKEPFFLWTQPTSF